MAIYRLDFIKELRLAVYLNDRENIQHIIDTLHLCPSLYHHYVLIFYSIFYKPRERLPKCPQGSISLDWWTAFLNPETL
ncbi:hypothetical protein G7B40_005325 [Aetokthonos hydrillicola Thurmond2011]|uniref:Uncharacterized protein n=1 Tax=Aetokthonos hydrillicola Thurmond2011 TaxID=2712845 RepID=A0AAP5I566_9CYAN|nr:hypothetical protein [Aetokthonos hydrillicola]MBO3457331.1 hypothetical protein [Aetokthonos hydrillicola CCALA 1050]MBW4586679.1 hypothetical protein [Aetokthonos hydrillicola CCALA 1050]MDR9893994.1 hypothetical protein [Aetokthonos hydrillicola Thurmond2011]